MRSLRVAAHHQIQDNEYNQAMLAELENLDVVRLSALDHIKAQKRRVERAYNKRVRVKTFSEGDLVWKTILPVGKKDRRYGKWSPNWEGPFKVLKVLRNGAYHLQDLDGDIHVRSINGRYLKKYYPSLWESMDTNE